MRWVIALFVALLSIPVAQVAADAWNGRPGPQLTAMRPPAQAQPQPLPQPQQNGADLVITRHPHNRLYDPLSPWLPVRAKTS
jgi:hypothetical protein